ncbi:Probable cysteine desulfurase [Linum perenne]
MSTAASTPHNDQFQINATGVGPGSSVPSSNDLCSGSESFRKLDNGVLRTSSPQKRLAWVRSQIIGHDSEFDSPFGKRRITYADHTASGRSLHYVENFIISDVLPYYGCLKKCLTEEERWVVFVGPYEHHSNLLSWRQSLAEVVEIGLGEDGLLDMEALRRELKSGKFENRPILGSFSACSNVTGIQSDTREIAELLHRHGGFACFDFAASGPYTEIDMRSGAYDGYDAIFLGPHKFLGGPGTPGILLMSKALYRLGSSPPSTCGGGTVDYDTLYMEEIESREMGGTPPIIEIIRAALAFWTKEYITYPVIQTHENMFIERALLRLVSNKNIMVLGNTEAKRRQGILSFLILSTSVQEGSLNMWAETGNVVDKPLHGPFVAMLLNDLFGIQARGGCACAGPYGHQLLGMDEVASLEIRSAIQKGYVGVKPGWARISFPYYMSDEEFEFILAAVEFLAMYGQRFLHLYRFNFRNGCWTLDKGAVQQLVNKLGNSNRNRYGGKRPVIISKFSSYLEIARNIASLLPKFPREQEIPGDLEHDILHFRV